MEDQKTSRRLSIKIPQGEVEIAWTGNPQPGFCPYCHKCIPFDSVAFKDERSNDQTIYSGADVLITTKQGVQTGLTPEHQTEIGQCPYCHKPIPVREIIFKKG